MFKKFKEGLVFGGGFGISFVAIWFISAYVIFPKFVVPHIEQSISETQSDFEPSSSIKDVADWNALNYNEMIQKASAIIVLRYKQEKDGLMSAYVAEIYKKEPSVEVKEKIGNRREDSDYYSRGGNGRDRDGAIILLTGSPAKERSTLYLYDNRLAGADDMPVSILLKKFNDAKSQKHKSQSEIESQNPISDSNQTEGMEKPGKPFHELSLDDQIKQASVIAIAKYEKSSDGKMKAILKEFLKKEPGTTIYYNIGDEYPGSSYYPKENTMYGDGVIIFFTGSPATMKMSMTYSGDRIRGLGDIPIELFRKKCNDKNA